MKNGKKVGLCLSGGGYRATIYHLGTLRKLHEMGILKDVDVISTVSGGSITGAYFGLHGSDFEKFEKGLLNAVQANVITAVLKSLRFLISAILVLGILVSLICLLFTSWAWASFVGLISLIVLLFRFQFALFPLSKIVASVYDRYFFEGKTLKDFNTSPVIAINSTNISTGRPFTFSRNKMSDSAYEYPVDGKPAIRFKPDQFPISYAVAASTCVPFAFTPVDIPVDYFENEEDTARAKPKLVDGGVYDNQGIHKLTQKGSSYECHYIIVSDAGNMMSHETSSNNTITLLIRTGDLFMNRIKNVQQILHIFENSRFNRKQVGYQSLGWDFENSIKGFIESLKRGAILEETYRAHGITEEDIKNQEWETCKEKLETSVQYQRIVHMAPSEEERKIARGVSTNLMTLSRKKIDCLMKQAQCMTDLQVRLYCPDLI